MHDPTIRIWWDRSKIIIGEIGALFAFAVTITSGVAS